jgi:cytochrome c oxidase subunit 3
MDLATHPFVSPPARRKPAVPSAVLGTLIFLVCEVMFFSGCLSAFTIARASVNPLLWPPPNQPRLPQEETLFNTAALLLSGAVLFYAYQRYRRSPKTALLPMSIAWALGAAFVGLQGMEWWRLLGQGLTITSSSLGSFFYLLVGGHAIHAVAALGLLGAAIVALRRDRLGSSFFFAAQAVWYFVVLMWPVIYVRLYF